MQLLANDSPLTLSQCLVFLEIGRRRESTVGELAAYLELDKSTLSRTVDSLLEKNYAEREPFANDRRYNRIFLSEEGLELNESLDEKQEARIEAAFAKLSPERREEIFRAFATLVEAFELIEAEAATEDGGDGSEDDDPDPARTRAASGN